MKSPIKLATSIGTMDTSMDTLFASAARKRRKVSEDLSLSSISSGTTFHSYSDNSAIVSSSSSSFISLANKGNDDGSPSRKKTRRLSNCSIEDSIVSRHSVFRDEIDIDIDFGHHHAVAPNDNRCNSSTSSSSSSINNNNNNSITNSTTKSTTTNNIHTSSSVPLLIDELTESLLFPIHKEDVFPMIDKEEEEDEEDTHVITVLLRDQTTTKIVGLGEYLLDAMEWPKSEHSISVLPPSLPIESYLSQDDSVVHHHVVVTPDESCNNSSGSASGSRDLMNENNNNNNSNTTAADRVDSVLSPTVEEEEVEDELLTLLLLLDTEPEIETADEFGEFLLDVMQWL